MIIVIIFLFNHKLIFTSSSMHTYKNMFSFFSLIRLNLPMMKKMPSFTQRRQREGILVNTRSKWQINMVKTLARSMSLSQVYFYFTYSPVIDHPSCLLPQPRKSLGNHTLQHSTWFVTTCSLLLSQFKFLPEICCLFLNVIVGLPLFLSKAVYSVMLLQLQTFCYLRQFCTVPPSFMPSGVSNFLMVRCYDTTNQKEDGRV